MYYIVSNHFLSRTKFFFILFLIIFSTACTKKTISTKNPTIGLPNEYLDAKARIDFKNTNDDANFKVKFRQQKDKRTWATFTGALGIEGLRVVAKTDSLFMIDYLNNKYEKATFDTLAQILNFPIEYPMLQNLLMGDMPNADSTGATIEGDFIKISQKIKHISAENKLYATNKKLAELYLSDTRNQNNMLIQYSDYRPSPVKLFPFKINISVDFLNNRTKKREKTTVNMEFMYARFGNVPLEFPFVVPKSYLKNKK